MKNKDKNKEVCGAPWISGAKYENKPCKSLLESFIYIRADYKGIVW